MKKKSFLYIYSGILAALLLSLTVIIVYSYNNGDKMKNNLSKISSIDGSTVSSNDSSPKTLSTSEITASTFTSSGSDIYQNSKVDQQTSKISTPSPISNNTSTSISKTTVSENRVNLLVDPNFLKGFSVRGLGGNQGSTGVVGVFNYLNSTERPFWSLAQWTSRYDFTDKSVTTFNDFGNGIFRYSNPTKNFTIDTKNAILTFTGITSACYDKPRTTGSDPWFHILIESTFSVGGNNPNAKVSDLKSVQVNLSSRLTKFEDKMNGQANPGLHAAQFLMYLAIQNQDKNSSDYGQMIWFGFSIFDNRYEWLNSSSMYDNGTKSLMVGLGNRKLFSENNNYFFKDGKVNANPNNPWATFSIDVAGDIKAAYETARKQGYFKGTSYDQLYISGMNLGWEIPGVYDCEAQTKDLSIIVEKK